MKHTSLKQTLINNDTEANRGKIKGHLPLENIFGFCKTFKQTTKDLGFNLDLQVILFKTLGNDINVTINSLFLLVPVLIPKTETPVC